MSGRWSFDDRRIGRSNGTNLYTTTVVRPAGLDFSQWLRHASDVCKTLNEQQSALAKAFDALNAFQDVKHRLSYCPDRECGPCKENAEAEKKAAEAIAALKQALGD